MAVKRVPRRRDGYGGGLAVRRPAQRLGFLEGRGGRCLVTATGVVVARGGDDAGEGTRFRREGARLRREGGRGSGGGARGRESADVGGGGGQISIWLALGGKC